MIVLYFKILAFFLVEYAAVLGFKWESINLPLRHIPLFLYNNPTLKEKCQSNSNCPYKGYLDQDICWGYENGCSEEKSYSNYSCPGHHRGWVATKEQQLMTFYNQGDFGHVKEHREQLQTYCSGDPEKGESKLECSDHLQFCRGRNIMIDFRDLSTRKEPVRYHMDVLKPGQIGGKCSLNRKLLEKNSDLLSPLQSWAPEMRFFSETSEIIQDKSSHCDLWVRKAAVITKIDASVSMYHHFCDFLNLYASQHVNNSDEHAFMTDTQVLIWETYPYGSNFGIAWKAFTKNSLWNLASVAGKRVCFENVMFPLLPRMIFGLYYNTPIIWGCENSGLFHSFAHHMLHRMDIPERSKTDKKIRVTFSSRQTKYRRILNEDRLIRLLQKDNKFIVRKVDFTHREPFIEQLKQDQWSDILIGIHGSGLTHLLFLPDWAVVFELYDCGDPNCYQDLARLRGVKYLTWANETLIFPEDQGHHPDLGAHKKFTNYSFDEEEFLRLVRKAAKLVKQHPMWKKLAKKRKGKDEL